MNTHNRAQLYNVNLSILFKGTIRYSMMGKKGPRDISKQRIWKDRYRVHSYEVGTESTVRLSCLCNYLQESAWNHVTNLKVGYEDLLKDGNIWVLSRLLIKINEYPKWGDEIFIKTWNKRNYLMLMKSIKDILYLSVTMTLMFKIM